MSVNWLNGGHKESINVFFLVLYRVFALEIDWAVFENLKILLGDI